MYHTDFLYENKRVFICNLIRTNGKEKLRRKQMGRISCQLMGGNIEKRMPFESYSYTNMVQLFISNIFHIKGEYIEYLFSLGSTLTNPQKDSC